MPYKTLRALPPGVRSNLPKRAQQIYLETARGKLTGILRDGAMALRAKRCRTASRGQP